MTMDQETINTAIALVTGLVAGTTQLRACAWWLREVRLKEELEHPGLLAMEVVVFAWTELGAERIGVIQSLLATCHLHGVDPYTCDDDGVTAQA